MVIGFLADKVNRIKLLAVVIILGAGPCMLTVAVTEYWHLLVLRSITGIAGGGALPLIYSLLGDLIPPEKRNVASSGIAIAAGAGIVLGQILSGIVGPRFGWKVPYAVVAAPNVLFCLILLLTVKEPKRGGQESAMNSPAETPYDGDKDKKKIETAPSSDHVYTEKLDWQSFKAIFSIKSNLFCFMQALFGTIPWGFITVFMNDYIAQDKGFGNDIATLTITVFGVAAVVAVVGGGPLGQYLMNRSRKAFCYFLGITTSLGAIPIIVIVLYPDYNVAMLLFLAFCLGFFASITGPNIRVVVLNVNTPATRGTAFAFFNLADDVGKGLGPYIVAIMATSMGRLRAFSTCSVFWFVASIFHFLLSCHFEADEKLMDTRVRASIVVSPSKALELSKVLAAERGLEQDHGECETPPIPIVGAMEPAPSPAPPVSLVDVPRASAARQDKIAPMPPKDSSSDGEGTSHTSTVPTSKKVSPLEAEV